MDFERDLLTLKNLCCYACKARGHKYSNYLLKITEGKVQKYALLSLTRLQVKTNQVRCEFAEGQINCLCVALLDVVSLILVLQRTSGGGAASFSQQSH